MESRLLQVLSHLALNPADVKWQPLEGGITNRNFLVGPYVVRLGGENTAQLGIDRFLEETAARWAADKGLGAEVAYIDPAQDVMVTRFVEGSALAKLDPETLRSLARLLRQVHSGPTLAAAFSPFQVVRDYYARALGLGVVFPDLTQVFGRMKALEESLEDFTPCCCHNDLLAANFIHDGSRWRLIDWEYAAMGDPYFDLGNFAVNQNLGDAATRVLLQEYFGEVTPAMLARLDQMRQASDLREAFWGFLQSGLSSLDFDFRAYGQTHLDRFLAVPAGRP